MVGRTNLGIYGRRWLEEGGGVKDKPWNLRKEVARRRRQTRAVWAIYVVTSAAMKCFDHALVAGLAHALDG